MSAVPFTTDTDSEGGDVPSSWQDCTFSISAFRNADASSKMAQSVVDLSKVTKAAPQSPTDDKKPTPLMLPVNAKSVAIESLPLPPSPLPLCRENVRSSEEGSSDISLATDTSSEDSYLMRLAVQADKSLADMSFVQMVRALESADVVAESDVPEYLASRDVLERVELQRSELKQKLLLAMATIRMLPNTIDRLCILPLIMVLDRGAVGDSDGGSGGANVAPEAHVDTTAADKSKLLRTVQKVSYWNHLLVAMMSSLPLLGAFVYNTKF